MPKRRNGKQSRQRSVIPKARGIGLRAERGQAMPYTSLPVVGARVTLDGLGSVLCDGTGDGRVRFLARGENESIIEYSADAPGVTHVEESTYRLGEFTRKTYDDRKDSTFIFYDRKLGDKL